jgi:hypothetical protein
MLVRSDRASTRLAWYLREQGVGFSLGMPIDAHVGEAKPAWTPASTPTVSLARAPRRGELTGWVDLHTWPAGTRGICRREDTHPAPSCASATTTATASRACSPTTRPDLAGWSCGTANAPGWRTASAPPRPPAWPASPWTDGAATASGWSWPWPPKTALLDPGVAAGGCARHRRGQDPARPAVACRRADRPPRPPHDPSPATLLALGGRPRQGVRLPARPPTAPLTIPYQRPPRPDPGRSTLPRVGRCQRRHRLPTKNVPGSAYLPSQTPHSHHRHP